MEEINLTINGKAINCPPGTSILDAAKELRINIPTLCNHSHLKPSGACRLCIVEDEKSGRILASCVTPVSHDMSIHTESPIINRYRADIIRLILSNHPESCVLCNKGNRCELRQVASDLGVGDVKLYPMPHYTGLEESNPFILRDLSKCILCGRCIRADHELVLVGAIDYNLRGLRSKPAALHGAPLEQSECTFCGTCVSMCPTGALMTKNTRYVGSPQKESSTICGFCGVGCSLVMGSVDGQVVEVNPSHEEGAVNMSTLCVRGHFANDYLNSRARLTIPLIRRDNELVPASWNDALELVADRLMKIKKENGPQSLAFMGSSKCTNEENYLFQKIARRFFETNNIDSGGYTSGRPVFNNLNKRLDGGERVRQLKDLEKAELIFALGADPLQTAPVAGYFIKRASRMREVPLIVVDPVKTDLSPFASLVFNVNPQMECELLNGLAAVIYRQKLYDIDFTEQFTEGFRLYCKDLDAIDFNRVSKITGIDPVLIEKAADLMNGKKTAFVVGQDLLRQRYAAETMDALINLSMMTGSLAGEGSGIYLLSNENNQAGSLDMGVAPDYLPGRVSLGDAKIRKYWERNWATGISPDPGLDMIRMVKEAENGNLKAIYVMGENPLRSLPQAERVKKSLGNLEFLVVQDILLTETAGIADVVLPGAAFNEKGGSFTNTEGRIQFFDPVVNPPVEARPDWEILDLLYEKIGKERRYESLKKIQAEIGRLIPMYADMKNPGNNSWVREISGMKLFNGKKDGAMIPFSEVISVEEESLNRNYPFKALLGPSRYHLGSGTRTSFSSRMKEFEFKGMVAASLEDSDKLNCKEGDRVRISSPYGSIRKSIKPEKGIREGLIYIPLAFNDNDAMTLIELTGLGKAGSPGWNVCDVRLDKIS